MRRTAPAVRPMPPVPEPFFQGEPFWRLIPRLQGASSNVITVLDAQGTVRYQSRPVRWLLGHRAEDLVGRPFASLLCAPSVGVARAALAHMAAGGARFDLWRLCFRTVAGEGLWLEGMASNFLKDPRLDGIMVYWRELTG